MQAAALGNTENLSEVDDSHPRGKSFSVELFGSLNVMVTGLILFRLRKRRCSCSSGGASLSHPKFVCFAGLVDKKPNVVRGIMIDTGASINIQSKAWYERFVDTGYCSSTVESLEQRV